MIKKFDNFVESFAKWGVIICLFSMLFLSLASIVLRWFGISFHWIDPAARHFVLLAAFFGGTLATGNGQNIRIDLLSKVLENKKLNAYKKFFDQIVTLFTLVVVLVLIKATWDFVKVEIEFGKTIFWGIHSGLLVAIIPFGFLLILLRLVCRLCLNLKSKHSSVEG